MANSSQAPRRAAVQLLQAVLEDRRSLQEVLAKVTAPLQPADRARAQRLASETLRRIGRCDAVLKPFLRKPPPPFVRDALRLAVWELHGDKSASHGVVNDAVNLVRSEKNTSPFAGLTNAVLRKAAAGGEAWEQAGPQRLPKWLRGRLNKTYGAERVLAMEAAHEAGAALDLTLKAPGLDAPEGQLLESGTLRLEGQRQVSALPGYDAGAWWVQDAAAACPVRLMPLEPGMRVLDLCTAPGGKTMQLAAAGAEVTALDSDATRMERLVENLARTGLQAETVVGDALTYSTETLFDAVLLDAPCSATGTIRRHPDLPFVKDGMGLRDLYALQATMIDHALSLLAPGGVLMYCTCSLLPEEGERQVEAAIERHKGLGIEAPEHSWVEPEWTSPEGGLRMTPDMWAGRGGIDGFYMALIRKPA